MRRTTSFQTGMLLGLVALLGSMGCGGGDAADGPLVSSHEPGQPPGPPEEGGPGDGPGAVFAISSVMLGRDEDDGIADYDAWEHYGYDLDHTQSDEAGPGTCSRISTGSKLAAGDGDDGIDNAFMRHVVWTLRNFGEDVQVETNVALQQGGSTPLFHVTTLGEAASYTSLPTVVYESAPLPSKPAYGGEDVYPVTFESVEEGDPGRPISRMEGYLIDDGQGGYWVGRGKGPIVIRLRPFGASDPSTALRIAVLSPIVTMQLSEDRTHAKGILAGIVLLDDLLDETRRFVGLLEPDLCDTGMGALIVSHVASAADIRSDGSVDPNVPCDAVSLGIGFEADRVQLGDVAEPAAPLADPCAM